MIKALTYDLSMTSTIAILPTITYYMGKTKNKKGIFEYSLGIGIRFLKYEPAIIFFWSNK